VHIIHSYAFYLRLYGRRKLFSRVETVSGHTAEVNYELVVKCIFQINENNVLLSVLFVCCSELVCTGSSVSLTVTGGQSQTFVNGNEL